MSLSPRLRWPIPDENTDPFIDAFDALIAAIDATVYGPAREDRNLLIQSTAVVSWNATTGVLSWSKDIELLAAPAGFLWQVPTGNTTLQDGELLYVVLTRAPTSLVTLSVRKGFVIPVPGADDAVVLAVRRGTRVFFRTGKMLSDGDSFPLFDAAAMQAVLVQLNGADISSRTRLNFAGMVTVADDGTNGRANITIPQRGLSGEKLVHLVPIVMGRDTDSTGYISAGHFRLNKADYNLTGATVAIELLGQGYVGVSGVTGRVRLSSLDASFTPVVLTWAGETAVTEHVTTVTLPSGNNRYRVEFQAAGSVGSLERFYADWAGFRITQTFNA